MYRKACPSCHTPIGINIFSNNKKILRCPACKKLLIENPKQTQVATIITFAGLILGLSVRYFLGVHILWAVSIIAVFWFISLMVTKLKVINKDLIIRNKQDQKVYYIDNDVWDKILKKYQDKENPFEIIERL